MQLHSWERALYRTEEFRFEWHRRQKKMEEDLGVQNCLRQTVELPKVWNKEMTGEELEPFQNETTARQPESGFEQDTLALHNSYIKAFFKL
ncbi:unnamed protein product [Caenorhabditis bovis]|uniref:Uncharacterized protein n=1 Tax=Caenorhabditis bovis TaxID=2654633 RepID=A0A8S1E4X1_9PELO|nr:unnamed protein product [Caenorhabditis bovis]